MKLGVFMDNIHGCLEIGLGFYFFRIERTFYLNIRIGPFSFMFHVDFRRTR